MRAYTHEDLTGRRFNRLTVMRESLTRTKNRDKKWFCRCDCGSIKEVDGQSLKRNLTRSCGCFHKERMAALGESRITHGHTLHGIHSKTYQSWQNMIQRCTNPHATKYPAYGGRGIQVCNKWKKFVGFLDDMGTAPRGYTIERRNNNGNYNADNCYWIPPHLQARNRRNNRRITFLGKTQTSVEWANEIGISYSTFRMRLHRGWSSEMAITQPIRIK